MGNAHPSDSREGNTLHSIMQRFGGIILAILIAVVVVVVALIIISETRNTQLLESYKDVETLEELYLEYSILDKDSPEAAGKRLLVENLSAELIKKYPNAFPAQRALLVQASIAEVSDGDYARSSELYEQIARINVESHLVEPALFRAALHAERAGFIDKARNILLDLIERYPEGILAPRVLFNLGRFAEQTGDAATANIYYEQLALEFPSSGWTNLAKDRIILLGN